MNSGLKDKMYNFEVTPPAHVWGKVSSALDESHLENSFPSTLHDLQVQPPFTAWERIEDSLNEEVPQRRLFSPFLKYAAAAAILFLIAFGTIRLLNNNKEQTEIANEEKINPPSILDKTENVEVADKEADQSIAEQTARDNAALENSKHTYAKLDLPSNKKYRSLVASMFTDPVDNDLSQLSPQDTYKELEYAYTHYDPSHEETLSTTASRYIILMTPDGNIIRMSKKLGDLLCCVAGEAVDEDCEYQMKKWREKVAGASTTPSPGNFMDILSLVKSLQEN